MAYISNSMHGSHVSETLPQETSDLVDVARPEMIREIAEELFSLVARVTPEEFRWQEANYDRDSALGRELLYLIANNEWTRATAEIVDITRSDAISTTVKIQIDPDLMPYEASRGRTGRLWLPVLVLPPTGEPGAIRLREPDPFVTMTVTDANGHPVATLPGAEVRHRIAAGLAEIIVNMAIARWPETGSPGPSAALEQRLLLSAVIYRLLSDVEQDGPTGHVHTAPSAAREPKSRLRQAQDQLLRTLEPFVGLADRAEAHSSDAAYGTGSVQTEPSAEPGGAAADPVSAWLRRLVERGITVLLAFRESAVVVVAVERDRIPSMLAVQIPGRILFTADDDPWRLRDPRSWHWLYPGNWSWVPRAHLRVDLLLPSADADRVVQVNLPDGISAFPLRPEAASMEIGVRQPAAMRHLGQLMIQLKNELEGFQGGVVSPQARCLADLAKVKAVAARATLRRYAVGTSEGHTSNAAGEMSEKTTAVSDGLDRLLERLAPVSAGQADREVAEALTEAWGDGSWMPSGLRRVISPADMLSPQTLVAKAGMIDDPSSRAAPAEARIHVHVAVSDAQSFSIAMFSGWMSMLLMVVALVLLWISEKLFGIRNQEQVSPEVLAIVLTLFAAIQAGRIERPDRSTLRGMLSANSNGFIVLSILPAVVLAVALAFSRTGWWPFAWAIGCILAQGGILALGTLRSPLRARRRADGRTAFSSAREFVLYTHSPAYTYDTALHSSWWRATTADALMIHPERAHGYVVWRCSARSGLRPLLNDAAPSGFSRPPVPQEGHRAEAAADARGFFPAGDERELYAEPGSEQLTPSDRSNYPANLLALLHSGAAAQSLTFAVFREPPGGAWCTQSDVVVEPVPLDFDQLAPTEDLYGMVDIFVGVPSSVELLPMAAHPLSAVLKIAAEHQPLVIEAQMPVPPPSEAWTGLRCGWIRVGLRDTDIGFLADFLHALGRGTASLRPPPDQPALPPDRYVVAATTVSAIDPHIFSGQLPTPIRPTAPMILASDLDVVTASGPQADEDETALAWRVMAICANYRGSIESQIVPEVDPDLRLAGMTYALLQGKAVMMLLGYQPDKAAAVEVRPGPEARLNRAKPNPSLKVVLDRKQARTHLGAASPEPLLRALIRSPNRPGTTLSILDALESALRDVCALDPARWHIWHARTVVTAENLALNRFILRLSVEPEVVAQWSEAQFEAIAQRVRDRARKTTHAGGPGHHADSPGALDEFLVRIEPLTVPDFQSLAIPVPRR